MKNNKIIFEATSEYGYKVALPPVPASNQIPEWWRNMTPYHHRPLSPDGKNLIVENGESNASPKKCTPMLDAITSGYIIPLWADVFLDSQNFEIPRITWRVKHQVFLEHTGSHDMNIPVPSGYSKTPYKFINFWRPITPPGYSVLIVPPAGYVDSAIQAIPAIIDSDKSTLEIVPPVWVRKDFKGVIEAGTPILQVIPFKRENWVSEKTFVTEQEHLERQERGFNRTIINHYIKNVWSRKSYK